jgi:hypothetical protein
MDKEFAMKKGLELATRYGYDDIIKMLNNINGK